MKVTSASVDFPAALAVVRDGGTLDAEASARRGCHKAGPLQVHPKGSALRASSKVETPFPAEVCERERKRWSNGLPGAIENW